MLQTLSDSEVTRRVDHVGIMCEVDLIRDDAAVPEFKT